MNISPGILGTYWLLTSFALTAAWIAACELGRRLARPGTRGTDGQR
jgi:hypothetical protein